MVKIRGMLRLSMFFILVWGVLLPAGARVDVTIDRNPVQVNESFQIVFSLDENPDRRPDFSVLHKDFLVIRNNQNSSISIVNGQYQRSVKWTLQLMAKQIGEFEIPAIDFGSDSSEPFVVTVKPSTLASVPHDQLVLELLVDKPETYVQSQLIVTLRLLSATDLSTYQFGEIDSEGLDLVVEPLGDGRQYQTRIADRSYLVLEKRYALFPQQSGQLTIPPVIAEVRLPSRSRFDPFQRGGEIRRFRSQPLEINVKPVPADFSGDFWLPADRLELREQWPTDLSSLVAGEPVTRSLALVAEGLTAAQLPDLVMPPVDGLKQYPDQPVLENSTANETISGRRVQKVALIPGAAGVYRLPEISVDWWNRTTGRMETAKIPARELYVAAAAPPAIDTTADSATATPAPVSSVAQGAPASRFWLWTSLFLACGWGLSAAYWWFLNRRARLSNKAFDEPPRLGRSWRDLQQACGVNDAPAARVALLAWGRALLAPQAVANLNDLARLLGEEMKVEIDNLNHCLYAGDGGEWTGQALSALCQGLQKNARKRDAGTVSGLAALNP